MAALGNNLIHNGILYTAIKWVIQSYTSSVGGCSTNYIIEKEKQDEEKNV